MGQPFWHDGEPVENDRYRAWRGIEVEDATIVEGLVLYIGVEALRAVAPDADVSGIVDVCVCVCVCIAAAGGRRVGRRTVWAGPESRHEYEG